MNFERLAREFVRALRGPRSQAALSRRLKCRSNVIYAWESGTAFPTAARSLSLARLVGVEPAGALERFYRTSTCTAAEASRGTPTWCRCPPGSRRGC